MCAAIDGRAFKEGITEEKHEGAFGKREFAVFANGAVSDAKKHATSVFQSKFSSIHFAEYRFRRGGTQKNETISARLDECA